MKSTLPRATFPLAFSARVIDFFSPRVAVQFFGSPLGVGTLMGVLSGLLPATSVPAGNPLTFTLWLANWALTAATVLLEALANAVFRPASILSLPLHFSRAK